MDNYLVKIDPIDDDIILATDPDTGNELLRFGVQIGGRWVKIQFPRFGDYQQFLQAVQQILYLFTQDDESIKLPAELAGVVKQSDFAARDLMKLKAALLVRSQDIGRRIEATFFKFLRPEVETDDGETLAGEDARKWISENASYDVVLNMFAAILVPEELLKKKALYLMKKAFPHLTKLVYSDTSIKNSDGQKEASDSVQNFAFA